MRDRDVRLAIQTLLQATGAFDAGAVTMTGLLPDVQAAVSDQAAAVIDPVTTTFDSAKLGVSTGTGMGWDSEPGGGIIIFSSVTITLLFRHEDPELRDEGVERLFDVAANALNGQCLATITLPAFTRFSGYKWVTATPPERQIVATFGYQYILEGWTVADETV